MTETLAEGRQSRAAALYGWALFVTFFALFWNILMLPRTALDQREVLRGFHDTLGLIVVLLAGVRLYLAAKWPAPQPPRNLPPGSFNFNRTILVALYLTFVVTGLIGFAYAWGEGRDVVTFGITWPRLVDKSESLRMASGYLHSALGFYYMMLFSIWLAFGLYQHLRYRAGLLRLLPGARV